MEAIFGLALEGYWKRDHKTKYKITNDVGYTESESLQRYFINYNKFPSIEKKALKFTKGKILDVGCGAGRHVLYLQKKGLDITGIDSSKLAISVCRQRGCKSVVAQDIFKFKNKTFDTILLFGNNIGIGGNLNGVKRLLKKLRSLAKKGSILMLNSIDVKITKNVEYFAYHKRNLKLGRYIGQVKLKLGYKNKFSKWFNWVHIDSQTLKKIALESKWKMEKMFNEKNGEYVMVLKSV